MNIFDLNRYFWNFAFNNPEKIKPNHCAIYYFSLEHCNRLGWKKKFGFPTSMVLEATGIKSYSVFKKAFDELVEFGFFEVIEYSKNQYSSNIIALKENCKALDKALDKALIKHYTKQSESTIQSIDSINKQETNIPINNKQNNNSIFYTELLNSESWLETCAMQNINKFSLIQVKTKLLEFKKDLDLKFDIKVNKNEFASHFVNWLNQQKNTKVKPFFDSPA